MQKPKNVKEMAEFLGKSEDWVYTMCAARAIPFTRLPGEGGGRKSIRFTEEHERQILAEGEEPVVEIASPLTRRGAA
jgi:hypothetical protein